ncbi:hypothetical protein BaRGS_00033269 [Batillaria attramentaria]|uniref:NADH dehydrogenase [ubiquinone] 1 alpha subcomplex subunit 1 n=1 Tax=Batillaria attramentaria TaxID=370345 RepID=A0ABD0JLC5_9CAEN
MWYEILPSAALVFTFLSIPTGFSWTMNKLFHKGKYCSRDWEAAEYQDYNNYRRDQRITGNVYIPRQPFESRDMKPFAKQQWDADHSWYYHISGQARMKETIVSTTLEEVVDKTSHMSLPPLTPAIGDSEFRDEDATKEGKASRGLSEPSAQYQVCLTTCNLNLFFILIF